MPIALAAYFFPISAVLAGPPDYRGLALVATAGCLVALGLLLKRKMLGPTLDISNTSYAWGTGLLACFAALYFYSPLSTSPGLFLYLSFFALVASYGAYRFGPRAVRDVLPLLLIAIFLPLPAVFAFAAGPLVLGLIFVESVILVVVYVGLRFRVVLIPLAMLDIGAFSWVLPTLQIGGHPVPTLVLVPVPLLALLMGRVRSAALIPGPGQVSKCTGHVASRSGFCILCGLRMGSKRSRSRSAPFGLATMIGVIAVLLVANVPILALNGNVPYQANYTSHGVIEAPLPTTPAGWVVNSTTRVNYNSSEPYSIVNVYVPAVQPELQNYTVYYQIASISPASGAPTGELPGWTTVSNNFTQIGPLQGHLTAYKSPKGVLVVFQGKTGMNFFINGTFTGMLVGADFVREFKSTSVPASVHRFTSDLASLWVPMFNSNVVYSQWTGFEGQILGGTLFVAPFFALVLSSALIGWAAYRVRRSDALLDEYYRRAGRLDEAGWARLSTMRSKPGTNWLGLDLAKEWGTTPSSAGETLNEFSHRRIIRERYVEVGDELRMAWRTRF